MPHYRRNEEIAGECAKKMEQRRNSVVLSHARMTIRGGHLKTGLGE